MPSAWQIIPSESKDWRTTDGITNLFLATDLEKPKPGPRTALVRIRAAALNARDMMVVARDPIYQSFASPNLSPCADGAGEVEQVGEGSIWRPGQRVVLAPCTWTHGDPGTLLEARGLGAADYEGTLREYAVMPDDMLIEAPAHLSFEELAALPAASGTSANALFFGPMPFKKGMTILTQGTGGVSSAAIQLASASGATVIATSSSDSKLELARKMGATHTINYKTTSDWAAQVLKLTGGRGVDHVLDVAGAGTIEQSLQATRQAGLVSLIGFLSEPQKYDIVPAMLFGAKTLRGVFQIRTDMVAKALEVYAEHNLHPQISHVFEWRDAKDAFAALVNQSGVGKIIIKVGD